MLTALASISCFADYMLNFMLTALASAYCFSFCLMLCRNILNMELLKPKGQSVAAELYLSGMDLQCQEEDLCQGPLPLPRLPLGELHPNRPAYCREIMTTEPTSSGLEHTSVPSVTHLPVDPMPNVLPDAHNST